MKYTGVKEELAKVKEKGISKHAKKVIILALLSANMITNTAYANEIEKYGEKLTKNIAISNISNLSIQDLNKLIAENKGKNIEIELTTRKGDNIFDYIVGNKFDYKKLDTYSAEEYKEIREHFDKLYGPIKENKKLTELDKVVAIAEIIKANMEYDMKAVYEGGQYSIDNVLNSRNMKNAIKIGKTVCAGYADYFVNACNYLGIEAKEVLGIKGISFFEEDLKQQIYNNQLKNPQENRKYINHAWNQVKINNEWYNIDLTEFDNIADKEVAGKIYADTSPRTYFLVNDEEFVYDLNTDYLKDHFAVFNYTKAADKSISDDDILKSKNKLYKEVFSKAKEYKYMKLAKDRGTARDNIEKVKERIKLLIEQFKNRNLKKLPQKVKTFEGEREEFLDSLYYEKEYRKPVEDYIKIIDEKSILNKSKSDEIER